LDNFAFVLFVFLKAVAGEFEEGFVVGGWAWVFFVVIVLDWKFEYVVKKRTKLFVGIGVERNVAE
jgi:hypothetical protein